MLDLLRPLRAKRDNKSENSLQKNIVSLKKQKQNNKTKQNNTKQKQTNKQ